MAKKNKPNFTGNSEHRKNFIKLLEQIAYDKSPWNVFTDFLQLATTCLSNQSDPYFMCTNKKTWDEREQRYLNTIKGYNKKSQPLFSEMFAELVLELEEYCPNDFRDVLGEIFHELEFHNKWRGQFFTPQDVSNMIGIIAIDSNTAKEEIDKNGFFTLNEPCCGAGSMILGALNGMRRIGLNHSKEILVVANDIDERCVMMCYIQLSLYGVPAIIRQQNTITMETFGESYFTPAFVIDGWRWKMRRAFKPDDDFESSVEVVPEIEEEETALKVDESGQFCLF